MNVKGLIRKAIDVYEAQGEQGLKEYIKNLSGAERKAIRKALGVSSIDKAIFKIIEFAHMTQMG